MRKTRRYLRSRAPSGPQLINSSMLRRATTCASSSTLRSWLYGMIGISPWCISSKVCMSSTNSAFGSGPALTGSSGFGASGPGCPSRFRRRRRSAPFGGGTGRFDPGVRAPGARAAGVPGTEFSGSGAVCAVVTGLGLEPAPLRAGDRRARSNAPSSITGSVSVNASAGSDDGITAGITRRRRPAISTSSRHVANLLRSRGPPRRIFVLRAVNSLFAGTFAQPHGAACSRKLPLNTRDYRVSRM